MLHDLKKKSKGFDLKHDISVVERIGLFGWCFEGGEESGFCLEHEGREPSGILESRALALLGSPTPRGAQPLLCRELWGSTLRKLMRLLVPLYPALQT